MKKNILKLLLLSTLLICGLARCQSKETEEVTEEAAEETTEELPVCSGCEQQKECETYVVDGKKYLVCDDCYGEFAYAHGLEDAPKDVPLEDDEDEIITPTETKPVEVVVPSESTSKSSDSSSNSSSAASTPSLPTCSGCQQKKECGSYTVDGVEYLVCNDCYDEFATGMGLKKEVPVCSGCQQEKECGKYVVNNVEYFVCDDCYMEFATGMGLIDLMVCSGCQVEKECSIYKVDGVEYIVCDDCYDEFATGMGLN